MKGKILIVDDEPNLIRMFEFALQYEGYQVVLARNGKEALSMIYTESFDLIVLDVMLPDVSGLEICQHLRSKPKTMALPVIMLSARGQLSDKIVGLESGADEYVTKPVDPDEVVARVNALLARTHRLRQASLKPQGKVIGLIGAKGGTGTTTVALNLAAALTRAGNTVTAVELRSHLGAFSAQVGRSLDENLSHLLQFEPETIIEQDLSTYLANHSSGLRLLYGPQRIEQYKDIDPSQAEALIKGLMRIAEYTVIDLPPYPSEAQRAALRLCHSVLLVIESDPGCIMASKTGLELLKSWKIRSGDIKAVLVNRKTLAFDLGKLSSQLNCEIVAVIPPALEACWAAQARGLPLVLYQPEHLAAVKFSELAGKLSAEKTTAMA